MIEVHALTKAYGNNKGIFDLSFRVNQNEIFGYLGPNGAGKTTTIRHLLGFIKADNGTCSVIGYDCWKDAAEVQYSLGYLPGEISFFDHMSGKEFLAFMTAMRGMKNTKRQTELIDRFNLDVRTNIRKMSKGMKQKLGIITAFMHDPTVYILDEPTSGLDPLMQTTFVELILEEKARGKTILMSSHSFEEIDRTCDRVGIIREGKVVAIEDIHSLKAAQRKAFVITVESQADIDWIRESKLEISNSSGNRVEVVVSGDFQHLFHTLAKCKVTGFDHRTQNLEQLFMKYYGSKGQ
ncbi:ABC transporter ATP-binding protein [Desulfuribacillus stibiiarsenatis]|uniref:ABC transporter ATP-binding protein n=1 Tax=Desulfuribacillus stibiiarsenatis TaxID=1390249 RepID=A0A1E5L4J6_9FIRM|nr:ABC transporter ATP-binding protein [Desulfuribacillus stibiiarsenatis]OEH85070.1 ABC transporter ATP-binding protein [Desulfuribacillus stibiiarsenatis]